MTIIKDFEVLCCKGAVQNPMVLKDCNIMLVATDSTSRHKFRTKLSSRRSIN